jgi:hypothetical protein
MESSTTVHLGACGATTPDLTEKRTSRLLARGCTVLGPLARGGAATDEGAVWSFPVTNCRPIEAITFLRVARLGGVSLQMRPCHETRGFKPVLCIRKHAAHWPTRVDFLLVFLMCLAVLAFAVLQYHEHLWDFRTLQYTN